MLLMGGAVVLFVLQHQKRSLRYKLELEQAERSKQEALQSLLKQQRDELELKVHMRTTELTHTNTVLQNTLEELRSTQEHLIQNEKMASLGALIRNVSHELNNPIGAIRANTSLLQSQLPDLVHRLPGLLQSLSASERDLLEALLTDNPAAALTISTREERSARKVLQTQLQESGLAPAEAADKSNQLVQCGITEPSQLAPVLKSPHALHIIDAAIQVRLINVCFQNLNNSVDRTRKIVSALRMFYPGEQMPGTTPVNLRDAMEKALQIHAGFFGGRVKLVTEWHNNAWVVSDSEHIHLLLNHLLFNAVQAIGSNPGEVRVSISTNNTHAVLVVQDSGPGIPDNVLPRIFDPFFTTKKSGEGSGLGLYLSKRIVELYKGRIEVQTEPGCTRFTVYLPALHLAAHEEPRAVA